MVPKRRNKVVLSEKLDSQLQLIISRHCDELVRSHLETSIPENTAPTGFKDLRGLYRIFGHNKSAQSLRISAAALQILAQKLSKPFAAEHQRFVQLVSRAKALLKDADGDFFEKVTTAGLCILLSTDCKLAEYPIVIPLRPPSVRISIANPLHHSVVGEQRRRTAKVPRSFVDIRQLYQTIIYSSGRHSH